MNERATPFHCPYCGDEDLRPEEGGAWLCSSCRRVFSVKLIGLRFPDGAPAAPDATSEG
ncbi:Insertion element protein [Amycolatopsis antarctica]|uniref:Insertion element protein n=1 Tax=Amycolatopsis antarctica TaxID=1854586 RepID=A0A263D7Z0_9PSEU|nr:Insertion element protein [Amycolatopsis antarctica]OZM74622.1 Insertion element protein [Amycolatopsis antarctica]